MLSKVTDFLVAQLVLPMDELQSIVTVSVQDFKARSTTDEYDEAISDFNNRKNYENQLVILTDLAELDWDMPIDFDVIFDVENPSNQIKTKVLVQHIVSERGLPIFYVERGLRHMLLLEFVDEIPNLVKSLAGYKNDIETEEVKHLNIGFGVL